MWHRGHLTVPYLIKAGNCDGCAIWQLGGEDRDGQTLWASHQAGGTMNIVYNCTGTAVHKDDNNGHSLALSTSSGCRTRICIQHRARPNRSGRG